MHLPTCISLLPPHRFVRDGSLDCLSEDRRDMSGQVELRRRNLMQPGHPYVPDLRQSIAMSAIAGTSPPDVRQVRAHAGGWRGAG